MKFLQIKSFDAVSSAVGRPHFLWKMNSMERALPQCSTEARENMNIDVEQFTHKVSDNDKCLRVP